MARTFLTTLRETDESAISFEGLMVLGVITLDSW